MKHSSTCLAIAGIFLASLGYLGYVNAADVPQAAAMHGGGAMHQAMHDPVAAAQNRLDKLGKKLNLKSSQQDAWKTFSAAMLKHAQDRAQEMGQRGPGEHAKMDEMATPDKMEEMAARMRKGADSLSKLASDTKPFYAQLSPEQKTIFDLYAKNAWHNRMHDRMHGPMH